MYLLYIHWSNSRILSRNIEELWVFTGKCHWENRAILFAFNEHYINGGNTETHVSIIHLWSVTTKMDASSQYNSKKWQKKIYYHFNFAWTNLSVSVDTNLLKAILWSFGKVVRGPPILENSGCLATWKDHDGNWKTWTLCFRWYSVPFSFLFIFRFFPHRHGRQNEHKAT